MMKPLRDKWKNASKHGILDTRTTQPPPSVPTTFGWAEGVHEAFTPLVVVVHSFLSVLRSTTIRCTLFRTHVLHTTTFTPLGTREKTDKLYDINTEENPGAYLYLYWY